MPQFPRALALSSVLLTAGLLLFSCGQETQTTPGTSQPAPTQPAPTPTPAPTPAHPYELTVSADGHRLVHADGTPFLYLADTGWELFHRLNREDARQYLQTRRAQGFTVIQAVALAQEDGLTVSNPYGDLPMTGKYTGVPRSTPGQNPADAAEYDYWDHVDYIVDQAASLGLYVALVPVWGKWVNADPVFTPTTARAYGLFLGQRYKDKPIIWVLGGDYNPDTPERRQVWEAMVAGIEEGVGGRDRALVTYHTSGGRTSAEYFHNEPWLDFNMWQTGHCINGYEARAILPTYRLTPAKPVLNAELIYEGHAICHDKAKYGSADDTDVRMDTYWSTFAAGGAGVTYGNLQVWGFDVYDGDKAWVRALNSPGARQLGHLKALLESRSPEGRHPDETLVKGSFTEAPPTVVMSGPDYAWVYLPYGGPVTVTLGRVGGSQVQASWFNPRTGEKTASGTFANTGERTFTAPSSGRGGDWVLVLDAPR